MIDEIRNGILEVDGAINDPNEDFASEDGPGALVSTVIHINQGVNGSAVTVGDQPDDGLSKDDARRDYNVGVLKYVQAIFGHLSLSKLQYYVPRGFWRHFK